MGPILAGWIESGFTLAVRTDVPGQYGRAVIAAIGGYSAQGRCSAKALGPISEQLRAAGPEERRPELEPREVP